MISAALAHFMCLLLPVWLPPLWWDSSHWGWDLWEIKPTHLVEHCL